MEKLEMKWSLKNRGYLKIARREGVCVFGCMHGYMCIEMKEWKKSIPENKRPGVAKSRTRLSTFIHYHAHYIVC